MMTPQKRRAAGGGAGSPTRYSILSDPRLSQLFALSSQLEALAQSIDVQPPNSKPELPPKPIPQTFVNNNNGIQSPSNSASPPPPIPPKFQNGGERSLEEKTSVKYTRLEEDQVENNAVVLESDELINIAPPPRYSTISDSHMSTSSQGAESTPSANSLLSESGELEVPATGSSECKETPTSEAEWQARCVELELALQKFRDQAHNIRKLLRDKLSELEQRVIEAESRAEDAEGKVRLMERRLNEVDYSSVSPSSATTNNSSVAELYPTHQELSVTEKDRIIRSLESEVEAQRALRLADAKAVEAKAARIKDWVTNKLRELEDQNAQLKVQNAKANDQMELLQKRLEHIQVLGASTKSRQSSMAEQDSSLGSFEGDPVASEESLTDIGIAVPKSHKRSKSSPRGCRNPQEAITTRLQSRTQLPQQACEEPEESESISGNLETPTPTRRRMASTNGGAVSKVNNRDSRVDSGSVDLETPLELSPKSPLEVLDEALNSVMEAEVVNPIAPPRTRNISASMRSNKGRSDSDCLSEPKAKGNVPESSNFDLPERHKSLHMPLAPLPITKKLSATAKKAHLMMSDEVHDYSEIYTPSTEEAASKVAKDDALKSLPPPRPLHRYPSWENRIYQVASEGMKDAISTGTGDSIDSTNNNSYRSDINVPVYATVKGRASQIRSVPFTGDSDSDSDSDAGELKNAISEENSFFTRGTPSRMTTTTTATTMTSSTSGEMSLSSPRGLKLASFKHPKLCTTNKASTNKLEASFDSEMSNDYAIPPDASSSSLAPLPSTPSRMLMSSQDTVAISSSPRKAFNNAEKALEKSGYLTKLGGKIKSWRKRYFVLKNGTLSYWKSQHDVHRKPQGLIILDEKCRVSRADGANTFEIATEGKTYYLTADSQPLMEDWVRVLQNVVQRNALRLLLSKEDGISPTLQGWLTKVKHGHNKKVWCVLVGKMFVYFKGPNDPNPAGQINMRDTRVEEVEHISSDSDSDEMVSGGNVICEKTKDPTVGIFPNHVQQGPTYLIFNSKNEQEQWLYHLTVVSGGDPKAGTAFEQLVQKLMEEDGNPHSHIWKNPLMSYTKDPIPGPLTTFTSEELKNEALKMFKSLLLFTNVILDSAGIDYHVMLAGDIFQQCLENPGLQQELLCALCKQTSRIMTQSSKHGVQSFLMNATQLFNCDGATKSPPGSGGPPPGGRPASPNLSAVGGADKSNPATHVFIQGWMLMAVAVSIFVPRSSKLLWFLRNHFARNKDSKTECGKYAAYCSRALERAVLNGPRACKPSRMEVLSILLKNPHHHSLPHALPVHFANDTYQVVGFDGSSTIAEFLHDLSLELGCRSVDQSGFTIFSDDPLDKDMYHALHLEDKVCDVISKWETALREKGSGKFENKRVIRFVYQNRLFWRKNVVGEVDRERLLFTYQISKQIVQGKFPLSKELAFELTALMAQIHYGDLNLPEKTSSSSSSGVSSGGSSLGAQKQSASEALEKFFPPRYKDDAEEPEMESCLIEKWASLRGKSVHDCVRIYLNCTRKWQFFGAQLFNVQLLESTSLFLQLDEITANNVLWMAISEEGVSVLDQHSMQPLARYPYDNVVTFGGCQEDFMLVITSETDSSNSSKKYHQSGSSQDSSGTTKLLFNAGKPQILQITLLIADYMNMMGKTAPGTLSLTSTPVPTPKNHQRLACSRSSSRARVLTAPNTPKPEPRISSNDRKKRSHME